MNKRWRASGLVFCGLFLILAANSTFSRAGDAALPSISTVLNPDGYVALQPESQGSFDPAGYRMVLDEKKQPRFVPESPEGLDFRTLARMQRDRATAEPPTRNAPIIFPGDDNWSTQYAFKGCDYGVFAVAAGSGGTLYIGGAFSYVNGVLVNGVARWNGTAWSALGALDDEVMAFATNVMGTIYVGGWFTASGSTTLNYIAQWSTVAGDWAGLVDGAKTGMNNAVYTLACDSSGNLYAGGNFTNAGADNSATRIAMWNGATWSHFGTGAAAGVWGITFVGTDLYICGSFTTAGGTAVNYSAKWNGSVWLPLGSGLEYWVYGIAALPDGVLFGGAFVKAGVTPSARLAKWVDVRPPVDMNGDCSTDLVMRNTTDGSLTVWYMTEDGYGGSGYLGGNTDMTWKFMGTGDLNGDGFADNVMRNAGTGDVYVQYNNASGPSGSLALGNKPTAYAMIGIADCDWDRRADILFRDTGTGMIDVWYVDETGVKGTAGFGPCAPATWTCVGVGDFAGNGNAGILWRNPTSGDMSLWFVDGTGFVKDVYMGNAATAWSVLNPVNFPGGVY